ALADLRRAWHRPDGDLPRRLRPPAGAHQRVLQRGDGRALRASRGADGPGARHHGQRPCRAVRPALPPGQFRLRPDGCGQQLGEGALHRGGGVDRQRLGRCPQGSRGLRLPPRFPDVPLPWRRYRRWHGYLADLQGSRGVPRSYHGDASHSDPESQRHRRGAVQRGAVVPPARGERGRVLPAGQRGALRCSADICFRTL
ncbi:unnamed protein product, partial [Prorocentrum cordatum]